MPKGNYTYKQVPKSKLTCGCGKTFYARKDARFCPDCRKQHTHDYFQRWYRRNKDRRALERKRPKITKPCIICGKLVTGNAYKQKCDKCLLERKRAYAKAWYLKHKGGEK